jgi:hypothetical protein
MQVNLYGLNVRSFVYATSKKRGRHTAYSLPPKQLCRIYVRNFVLLAVEKFTRFKSKQNGFYI